LLRRYSLCFYNCYRSCKY